MIRHLIRKLYPITPSEAARVLSHAKPMFSAKVIAKANEMAAEMGMPLIVRKHV